MTDNSPRPSGDSSRGLWVLILVLLAPAVVIPLLVPLYDKTDPTLWGFPFFFWAQLAMIPAAVVLTVASYYLAKSADRRDRAARAAGRGAQR
ncbi:hypothetical protein GCM10009844_30620 [Nocardioides koreensis]|uniref:DUF3311 domain-containing protein n=1 Tax=Nocardioides koreensis TaxID=433651 RepID=A0ABP5LSZ4_9ACTN